MFYVKFEPGRKYCSKKKEEQEISDSLNGFDDAGYILEEKDLVVDIDCLDRSVIEKLIRIFNIKTQTVWTDRGVHFYFEKPKEFHRAKGQTPLGFPVEYKHVKNTYATTVKLNGVARSIEYEGVRERLPDILKPGNYIKNMLGMDEGDGRNDALYAHKKKIITLPNHLAILRFINENIFDKPLEEREFDSLTRDEDFIFEKDQENALAEVIMRQYKTIKYNGLLYFYNEGHYISDDDLLKKIIFKYCPNQKTRYVDEVFKQIIYKSERVSKEFVPKIKFKNGYLNEGKFFPYNYTDFTPFYIDLDYKPDAEPVEIVDTYLNNLSDNNEEYRNMILEALALCLVTNPEVKRAIGKFFIFVGDGGNGKGTLIDVIKRILGVDNCTSIKMNQLTDERYLYSIAGKLVNLGDDLDNQPINQKQMGILKNLSTHDYIMIRPLYEQARQERSIATLIFTSNYVLHSFDKDKSYRRRVVWCPMYYKPKKKDFNFLTKLTSPDALEYWIRIVVEAYLRLYERQELVIPDNVKSFTEEYHRENDNTVVFVESLGDEEIEGQLLPDLYNRYKDWAEENGYNALSKNNLHNKIKDVKKFQLKQCRRNGKHVRIFKKLNNQNNQNNKNNQNDKK